MKYYVIIEENDYQIDLRGEGHGLVARLEDKLYHIDHAEIEEGSKFSIIINGESFNVSLHMTPLGGQDLIVGGYLYHVEVMDEREKGARAIEKTKGMKGPQVLRSVMPGVVRKVFVSEGVEVSPGTPLLILEAMKMENELCAEKGGVVTQVHVSEGQTVNSSDPLVAID